jgi:hypothetical protein
MKSMKRLGGWAVTGLLLLTSGVSATDDEAIQRAIDRGVAALKKRQETDGTWSFPQHHAGATALAGLTLLECNLPATDPAIRLAVTALRPATLELTDTYSLALAILFLDRLDDPGDVPLIHSMAVRLLAGQDTQGGWSYDCPAISKEEVRRLKTVIQNRREPITRSDPPRIGSRRTLPPEIQQQLRHVNPMGQLAQGDNSNTKFATLALWVARRHGMPVESALVRVETRFRASQNGDGGWGYTLAVPGVRRQSFGTMTCAGLLGLAMGHVCASENPSPSDLRGKESKPASGQSSGDLARDSSIRAGLVLVGSLIGRPMDQEGQIPWFNPRGDEFYFLWALERVAVAYGLKTIGSKDWYAWGTDVLLARQQRNGVWEGQYGESVDTCFALLFLRRANLSKDLSERLRGRVADPGKVTLTTGGVGGQDVGAKEPNLEKEAARLGMALVKAPASEQDALLASYKDRKGVVYTQALAAAIPQLTGAMQVKTRDALAARLARMTAATLRGRFQDQDREIRRAAASACALKGDPEPIPDLINLLDDPEPAVIQAAHVALKEFAGGKDFGPDAGAGRAERRDAIAAWKAWWSKQKR